MTTTPTQAQIEAAARAIYDLPVNWRANKPLWKDARYQYINEAKAALTAAAQVGEPQGNPRLDEVGVDRTKPIKLDAATIERCAQAVENMSDDEAAHKALVIAAIRKLKDAP